MVPKTRCRSGLSGTGKETLSILTVNCLCPAVNSRSRQIHWYAGQKLVNEMQNGPDSR
jgi:hypothetical protein